MARARYRRKDLKQPDEFVARGRDLIGWAQDNVRLVGQVAAAMAVIFIGVAAFVSMRSARTRQANDDLARALAEFRGGRYAQAATQLGEVAGRWESTGPGAVARIYAAQADLKANNFAAATNSLQAAQASPELPAYLKQQVVLDLGYALERDGKAKDAVERYNQAAALEGPYTATALLAAARAQEALGDKAAAGKLYERLATEFSQIPEIDLIKAKLGRSAS